MKIERTRTLVKELSGMLEEDVMNAEEAKEAGDGLDIQIVQDSIATDQQAILEERQALADLRQNYDIQLQELHEQKRSLRLERDEYEDNLRLLEVIIDSNNDSLIEIFDSRNASNAGFGIYFQKKN